MRRKVASPNIDAENNAKRKEKSTSCREWTEKRGKAKAAVPDGPKPTCIWYATEFTRESDVSCHEPWLCKLYPLDRPQECCPPCHKIISRNDAVLRHHSSDSKKQQPELVRIRAKGSEDKGRHKGRAGGERSAVAQDAAHEVLSWGLHSWGLVSVMVVGYARGVSRFEL